jgi:hypothetical protein
MYRSKGINNCRIYSVVEGLIYSVYFQVGPRDAEPEEGEQSQRQSKGRPHFNETVPRDWLFTNSHLML